MAVRVVSEWLNACSGCEISILNLGEVILDLIPGKLSLVHIPALVDSKYFGPLGDGKTLQLPEGDVAILSGGVRNSEHVEVVEEARRKCAFLISLGTCATNGGIPAQVNAFSTDSVMERVYKGCATTPPAEVPTDVVPAWTERVMAVDEIVDVDIKIPGCPPHPDWIADAVLALLDGKTEWSLPERSVCDTCQVIRREKSAEGNGDLKRPLTNVEFIPGEPVNAMRCLMEQGYFCMGTVTLAGCAGKGGNPRCIEARMPCRGCFGPIRKDASPMVDMMNALSSVGMNAKSLPDRKLMLNRFTGGHNNLRSVPAGGGGRARRGRGRRRR